MDYAIKHLWWFVSSHDCAKCDEAAGVYDDEPPRPHDNCRCSILTAPRICKLIASETTSRRIGDQVEVVAVVPRGGKTTKAVADTYGGSVAGSGGRVPSSEGGGTFSGGVTVNLSRTDTETLEFAYDPETGGESQTLYRITPQFEVTVTETWDVIGHDETLTTRETHVEEGTPRYDFQVSNANGEYVPAEGDPPTQDEMVFTEEDLASLDDDGDDGGEGDDG